MRTAPERQEDLKGCDIFISWQLLVLIRSTNEVFCAVAPRQPPFPAIIWIFITCFNEPCLQGYQCSSNDKSHPVRLLQSFLL